MWTHKHISDDARLTRLIFYPFMFDNETLDPRSTFQFQYQQATKKRQESLVWRLYVPLHYQINCFGCLQQQDKNQKKVVVGKSPIIRYKGHKNALCGTIRDIRTDGGYRFEIIHVPKEGIYHVHVSIVPPADVTLKKIDKLVFMDLRDELFRAFAGLNGHNCNGDSFSICRLATSRFVMGAYACFAVLGLFLKQALRAS